MRDDQESATAILPAVLRAAHQFFDDPRILVDPVAPGLVPGSSEEEVRAQQTTLDQPFLRHLRSVFVARSRATEDELARAVEAGVRQYVLLGAGLDTFPYRQPAWAEDLQIIEVDHPASQAYKRSRLAEAGIESPPNVELCAIDFEKTSLGEGLQASSFDPSTPTFFSWLGVTQYLTGPAIEATLRFVLQLPKPTTLVSTFALPEAQLEGIDLELVKLSAAGSKTRGEPWLSYFGPAAYLGLLQRLGFSELEHLSPEILAGRYYADRNDDLRAPVAEQLVRARV